MKAQRTKYHGTAIYMRSPKSSEIPGSSEKCSSRLKLLKTLWAQTSRIGMVQASPKESP